MRFWLRPPGRILLLLVLTGAVLLGAAVIGVELATRPPRQESGPLDFASIMVQVEDVEFSAPDGLRLSGWLLRGNPAKPSVVLAHDLGQSKSSLVQLAIALRKQGFSVMLLDFRGHGASTAARSTLGLHEKRDIIGAIDFLGEQEWMRNRHFGVYGVGMGAHAAVLAAAERTTIKVLVLDGLYPDVGYPLVRRVYAGWRFGVEYLGFVPRVIFCFLNQTKIDDAGAGEILTRLLDRDLLLLAPANDASLSAEIKRIHQQIPEQSDVDGNLELLPRTLTQGLYGQNLALYHAKVTDFFESRLTQQ